MREVGLGEMIVKICVGSDIKVNLFVFLNQYDLGYLNDISFKMVLKRRELERKRIFNVFDKIVV